MSRCLDCELYLAELESLRAALREAEAQRDEARQEAGDLRAAWEASGIIAETLRGRAEAAERKVDELLKITLNVWDYVEEALGKEEAAKVSELFTQSSPDEWFLAYLKVDEYRQALNVEHKIAMSPSIGNQHTEANRIEGCETCGLLARDALRVEQPRQLECDACDDLDANGPCPSHRYVVAEPERETPQSKHDEHFAAGFDAEGCELCMDAAECCQPEGKAAPFTLIHAEDCCRSG